MSLSQALTEVSQILSVCRSVQSTKSSDVTSSLPILDVILSEISCLVSIAQQQQNQQQQLQIQTSEDELLWDSDHDFYVYSDISSVKSVSTSDISTDSNTSYVDSEVEEKQLMQEIFIGGMVEAINIAAPGSVFDARKSERKRRKKLMRRMVPRVFQTMWRYCEELLTPPTPAVKSDHVIRPTVNWDKVNGRFLNNLPKPEAFPVMGCSPDPTFYQEQVEVMPSGNHLKRPSKFDSSLFPFGQGMGYMTQFGPVSISSSVGDLSIPMQGYIYDQYLGWCIYADNPWKKDKQKERTKEKMMPLKMKMRRSPRRRLR